jgi:hypothetical protein
MKLVLTILTLIFCIIQNSISAQYIIAGQSIDSDYSYTFSPDTTLYCGYYSSDNYCGNSLIPFDINNDEINDFTFKLKNQQGANGHSYTFVSIIPENNNQVAWGHTDTCQESNGFYSPPLTFEMAKNFNTGDTINSSITWRNDTTMHLYYNVIDFNGFSCGAYVSPDTAIFGVKVIKDSDTLYGWVKVNNVSTSPYHARAEVQGFACNKGYEDEPEITTFHVKVYPNPSKENINIELSNTQTLFDIELTDAKGVIITKQAGNTGVLNLSLKSLEKGSYFLQVNTADGSKVKKVIKL